MNFPNNISIINYIGLQSIVCIQDFNIKYFVIINHMKSLCIDILGIE